jgi:hypothetical protein
MLFLRSCFCARLPMQYVYVGACAPAVGACACLHFVFLSVFALQAFILHPLLYLKGHSARHPKSRLACAHSPWVYSASRTTTHFPAYAVLLHAGGARIRKPQIYFVYLVCFCMRELCCAATCRLSMYPHTPLHLFHSPACAVLLRAGGEPRCVPRLLQGHARARVACECGPWGVISGPQARVQQVGRQSCATSCVWLYANTHTHTNKHTCT